MAQPTTPPVGQLQLPSQLGRHFQECAACCRLSGKLPRSLRLKPGLPRPGQGLLAAEAQPFGDVCRDGGRTQRQGLGHARAQPCLQLAEGDTWSWHVHFGVIPLIRSALANACTALEQCVLTLPSEQPMAAAVSATSNSSQ